MKVLLFVEDDLFVREMAVAGLEDAGYEVIEAGNGGDALRLLQIGITLGALLTDIRLPGADGWTVARAYHERFPELPVLYVTGYAEQMQPVPGGIISKPYRMAQVIGVLATWAAWETVPLEQGASPSALTDSVLKRRSPHASLFLRHP
jgi:CheY-like chemotaxis protein